jgi:hypothetical protein
MASSIEQIVSDPELLEELKKLVLERVNVMPDTLRVAIGSSNLTKDDMINHVNDEDDVGKQVMELELEYLRALGSGAVYGGE